MMYGNYDKDGDRDYDKNFNCIKYLIYTVNIVILLLSIAMVGGSIYILVEKTFVSDIMDNQLLTAAVWLVILGGCLIIVTIPICGIIGAAMEKKGLLMAFIIFMAFLFLVFLGGGICAIVLRGEIGEWVIVKMETSLKDDYGVKLDNTKNRFITQQWDKAQEDMYCCGARDQSWGIFRQSNWYAEQPSLYGDPQSGSTGKPMVPESCCKVDRDRKLVNLEMCQMFMDGPPYRTGGEPGSNNYNNALHYRGCYEAGKLWIKYNGAWIIGFGIGFAAAMILAIIFSLLLVLRLRK